MLPNLMKLFDSNPLKYSTDVHVGWVGRVQRRGKHYCICSLTAALFHFDGTPEGVIFSSSLIALLLDKL